MKQVQDQLDFEIETPSDEEVKRRFTQQLEQHRLEEMIKLEDEIDRLMEMMKDE